MKNTPTQTMSPAGEPEKRNAPSRATEDTAFFQGVAAAIKDTIDEAEVLYQKASDLDSFYESLRSRLEKRLAFVKPKYTR